MEQTSYHSVMTPNYPLISKIVGGLAHPTLQIYN